MNKNIEPLMPIKATPYEHQKKAFAFACDKFGVFDNQLKSRGTALLMEMGTGKTIVHVSIRKDQPCVGGCAAFHPWGMGRGIC